MPKLEEIYEMIATDFVINETQLVAETTRSSDLFIKYIRLWSNEKLKVQQLENRKNLLVRQKRAYYAGDGTPEEYKKKPFALKIKTETEMQKYLAGDEDILAFEEGVIIQRQKVDILDACVKEIKGRGYQIKNIIEHKKFESGW